MKKEMNFRTVYNRENKLKRGLLIMFFGISSYPRLLLEVPIRSNFGERYFGTFAVIIVTSLMLLIPNMGDGLAFFSNSYNQSRHMDNHWGKYWSWYLYTIAFVYFSYRRWLEVKRNPSVFDCAKYSRHMGDINPIFRNIKIFGKYPNVRAIEIYVEPAFYFIAGILLALMGQALGTLFIICSIFYCLSYMAAYRIGDDKVMDTLDDIIRAQNEREAFLDDPQPSETGYYQFRGQRPNGFANKEKVADYWSSHDDVSDVS